MKNHEEGMTMKVDGHMRKGEETKLQDHITATMLGQLNTE